VGITCFSVVIGVVYQGRGNNLVYAVILHQMYNYTFKFADVDPVVYFGAASVVYIVVAVMFGVYDIRRSSRRATREGEIGHG